MKNQIRLAIFLLIAVSPALFFCKRVKSPTEYVNPFVDTHKSRWFFFSSASRPFGMVNLSPDMAVTGSWQSGYLYDSTYVRCFSHVHAWQLSGIPVMPSVGEFRGNEGMEATKSHYTHDTEIAKPGYHKIELTDYSVTAELTSTTRVGFHKYSFPKTKDAYINFYTGEFLAHSKMDSSYIHKVSETEIEGYSIMGKTGRRPKPTYIYFVAQFSQPASTIGFWKNKKILEDESSFVKGENAGGYLKFDAESGKPVLMKVAIAYTSIEQARKNLQEELPHWDFDKVVRESDDEWNEMLSRIKVEGGTEKQKVKFYTDLWHSLQGRRIVSDADGHYCDMTGEKPQIKQKALNEQGKPKFQHYNFDAWWGSHWTLNTLWSIAYPEIMDGFCNTMVDMYKDGGLIPRGPSGGNYTYVMIGDPATSFFATAINKGIRGFDLEKAYEGMRKNAFVGGIRDHAGYEHDAIAKGGGTEYYIERGYVPEGIKAKGGHKDGASMTLEYAYQDWCLAQVANTLGKNDDYDLFMNRSKNYKNLWNPATGYIHPKNMDGSWLENFEPIAEAFNTKGFCESNSAIYSYYVPHDLEALAELFGGKEKAVSRLEEAFEKAKANRFISNHGEHAKSWIDYENQPSCQMGHLFSHFGAPWKTQKWVREVKEITFGDVSPYGGYNGDEDQGQMGALGVLMSIGLFQMDGGAGVENNYDITSPIFDKITIKLNQDYYSGKEFTIVTENNSTENKYIQAAELNDEKWDKYHFPHEKLANGGTLVLKLGDVPNKAWGVE